VAYVEAEVMTEEFDQASGAPSLAEQAAGWKAAAQQMRTQVKAIYLTARSQATPVAYRQALMDVRAVQDGLEEYVAFAITVKGSYDRKASDRQGTYDEVWAVEVDRDAKSGVRRDMEGPRERYARHDAKVFAHLRAWRQAEQERLVAAEVLDEMWLRYRAINATREDLQAILRTYAFESSMERT
jgi:hypothetical protein